ncbi:MAG: Mur ligase family protein [Patescibacteria group bacterium]
MKYHFVGDQGISMRGLKEYLRDQGHEVSGSDLKTGGHRAGNVTPDIDVAVRTSAVSPGSPGWVEVEAAKGLGIKVIKRSELLGEITRGKKLVAVSGMHGKTTITALAGLIMIAAGLDPTVLVGEEVPALGGVLRIGKSDWFVAEICEYDRSFLDVAPEILILTNIEEEHLDTYPGGLPEIKSAFIDYIKRVKSEGAIIACADDANIGEVISKSSWQGRLIWYGFGSEKYRSLDAKLALPGRHNLQNALAVIALAELLKIDRKAAEETISQFRGAHRRFELKGEYEGAPVIDDYGHHPTEIGATISALAERYPDKKKTVVFWPHQYKRIKSLLGQFAQAFSGADEVILKPIYFVPGRDERVDVSSDDLASKINEGGGKAMVMSNDDEIIRYLKKRLNEESVLLTIGIPPVYKIADTLLGLK